MPTPTDEEKCLEEIKTFLKVLPDINAVGARGTEVGLVADGLLAIVRKYPSVVAEACPSCLDDSLVTPDCRRCQGHGVVARKESI